MTTETTPDQTKPRRRRLTISLRTLMILVLIVGGGIGWKASRASHQRRALVALKALNAQIKYDYQGTRTEWFPNGQPWGPEWLRKWIGEEYFQEIIGVDFLLCEKKLKDSDLA